jgi:hypothetical protein
MGGGRMLGPMLFSASFKRLALRYLMISPASFKSATMPPTKVPSATPGDTSAIHGYCPSATSIPRYSIPVPPAPSANAFCSTMPSFVPTTTGWSPASVVTIET